MIKEMTEKYATELATRLTLDDVIVKLVQNTAKSYSYKFTKYQKVRAKLIDGDLDGVVIDVKRSELDYIMLDYTILYYVYHILPDGEAIVNYYREDMLERIRNE